MPLTELERKTKNSFEENAGEWLEHSGGVNRCFWPEGLNNLSILLPKKSQIIEIGCGPATDGKHLRKIGFNVISIDYTRSMLNMAKELNPLGIYSQMDMQEIGLPHNYFDGFWATTCLLHLENPSKALNELVRVSNNGAIGFISIKEGVGEFTDPKTGYYHKYYKEKEFKEILHSFGMNVLESGRKSSASDRDYLTFLIRVNK